MGAAARGVDDDLLDPRGLEDRDGPAREVECRLVLPRVRVQGAATALVARHQHLGAVLREHARRRAVLRAEGHLLDAAGQQAHRRAPGALGGEVPREPGAVGSRRQIGKQRLPRRERTRAVGRSSPDSRTRRRSPLCLVEAEPPGGQSQQARVRERGARSCPAEERGAGARPGGWRSISARPASMSWPYGTPDGQTVSQARQPRQRSRCDDRRVRQRDAPLGERLDQEDAAARRVHLGAEDGEGRAVREAEPAVHARFTPSTLMPERASGAAEDSSLTTAGPCATAQRPPPLSRPRALTADESRGIQEARGVGARGAWSPGAPYGASPRAARGTSAPSRMDCPRAAPSGRMGGLARSPRPLYTIPAPSGAPGDHAPGAPTSTGTAGLIRSLRRSGRDSGYRAGRAGP